MNKDNDPFNTARHQLRTIVLDETEKKNIFNRLSKHVDSAVRQKKNIQQPKLSPIDLGGKAEHVLRAKGRA